MSFPAFPNCRVDSISSLYKFHTSIEVLRLDQLHLVVSGNKWFKLKEYIKEAGALGKKNLITWGGPFSNHLIATAAYAHSVGLKSIGLVRGERPNKVSPTLLEAISYGMDLFYLSRTDYKLKKIPQDLMVQYPENYIIEEGGYGSLGVKGAAEILNLVDKQKYTHILAAVGTGTTLAGIICSTNPLQQIVGISVFKNNESLSQQIDFLLPAHRKGQFSILGDYHFGGYAKYTPALIGFMNDWYQSTAIPSDIVYTAKLFYAAHSLVQAGYFPPEGKVLLIHSGGLQGNRSLPKGTLIF